MTILVTGSTGNIGSQVVQRLAAKGVDVRALARDPSKVASAKGVTAVKGDLSDVDSVRAAFSNVSTLFLLNAVTPEEVTHALIALNLARESGVKRFVYLSVIHSDTYTNVPHFAGKWVVEKMIEQFDLSATILRPAYFMQNDLALKDVLLGYNAYPMPIGHTGVAMIDTSDLADIATSQLIRREQSSSLIPRETIEVTGPDALTGPAIAKIWSEVTGKTINYGGDDTAAFEQQMRSFAPSWMAYDMRLMLDRIQKDGMLPLGTEKITALLGHPLGTYRRFAEDSVKRWAAK